MIRNILLQLMKDILNVNEATNWNKRTSALAMYKALNCYLENLPKAEITDKILENQIKEFQERFVFFNSLFFLSFFFNFVVSLI